MPDVKHLYESTFIINASIEDSQIEALIAHAQEIINSNGGEILALNKWGRKRLAYIIDKKNNGYYVNIEFKAPGVLIGRLEHMYLLDENVLRFLTIHLDKKAILAREQGFRAAIAAEAQAVPPPQPAVTGIPVVEKAPLFSGSDEIGAV